MIDTAVQNNGTQVDDPLAQAKALIAEEQQARINNVLKSLQENNCEARAVIQIGNQALLLSEVAGLPVIVQLVAK